MSTQPDIERLLRDEHARANPKRLPVLATTTREFRPLGDDRYLLKIPELGITFEIDRLRREREELIGQFSVNCDLPGARSFDGAGTLSIGDLNLSSVRARSERAKLLEVRAGTKDLDWYGMVEDF